MEAGDTRRVADKLVGRVAAERVAVGRLVGRAVEPHIGNVEDMACVAFRYVNKITLHTVVFLPT